jgi:hypothetical protein
MSRIEAAFAVSRQGELPIVCVALTATPYWLDEKGRACDDASLSETKPQ